MKNRTFKAGTGRATGVLCLLFTLLARPSPLFARTIDIASMPASPYADTEVSTNVVLRAPGIAVRDLSLRIQLEGTSSNNLELAFGRDEDGNGSLEFGEIDVVYGWRGGRYFIEDVRAWNRIEADAAMNAGPCVFDISLTNDGSGAPARFRADCGIPGAFAALETDPPPPWFYRARWNMVRAVRRGAGISSDWIRCVTGNNPTVLMVK